MPDLKNPRLIFAKGFLFLLIGLLGGALLVLQNPTLKTLALVGLTVWAFARFYYFAFYVIEHYVDPGYRFAGLISFAAYLLRRRHVAVSVAPDEQQAAKAQCAKPNAPRNGASA